MVEFAQKEVSKSNQFGLEKFAHWNVLKAMIFLMCSKFTDNTRSTKKQISVNLEHMRNVFVTK